MKQRLPGLLVFVIVVALTYIACQKKYSFDIPGVTPMNTITASLSGRVTDDNHTPVLNATVSVGASVTTTDLNGYFRFKNIAINNPDAAYVKVAKEGFFMGSRTYRSYQGGSDYVAMQLIKKVTGGTFAGSSGGSVTIPNNGGKIDFPANALVNVSGNASYTGTVSVAAFFINPAANDFQEMMPGTLRGIGSDNKQVGLQSYGMMAVELSGAGNERLNLASGKSATLTFPIQAGLQSQAPLTIPLWSFNDTTGLWRQEGTATKQGNNYVGTVSHFSFWNCDYPLPILNFKATYLNQNGSPLSYQKVILKTVDDPISTSGYGYTDSAGIITGTLPAFKLFLMTLYNKCGEPIDVRHVGPFGSPVDIGTFTVKTSVAPVVRFTGTVVNCNGTAVSTGFVDVAIENIHYFGSVVNGNFTMLVSRCSSNSTVALVTAIDDANGVQSVALQYTVADTLIATGQLTACSSSASEYLNYKLNNTANIFTSPADSISGGGSGSNYSVWFGRKPYQTPVDETNIVFKPTSTGSTPIVSLLVRKNNITYSLSAAANVTVTEYGPVGGFITGNFSTNVKKDTSAITYPFTASFRFKRFF